MTLDSQKAKNLALALLAGVQFMVVIDASIVNVALPSIAEALKFTQGNLSWVINAYVLVFGGFLLLGGRLADYLGRRRMFIAGLTIFSAASLLGGLATSDTMLIAARALQGLGAAIVSPAALSIITTTFAEGSERNRALGVWGAVAGAGGAVGVLLGGVLTEYLGWEWVLFVNVPIGLAGIVLAPRLLVESRVESSEKRNFDLLGAFTVTAGLALIVYGFVSTGSDGWTSTATTVRLLIGFALIGLFTLIETRASHPLMPMRIFRLRTLRGANIVGLLTGMALMSMFFFNTLYMQQVLGFSAMETGLAYLPLSLAIVVMAGVGSQLVTRVGFKPVLIVGALSTTLGMIWFAQISAGGSYWADVLGPSLLCGIGLGLSFVSVTIAAVTGTDHHEAGLASGLINTSQQVGGALGLAILASIANTATSDSVSSGERDPLIALTVGFHDAFLVGAGLALLSAFAAALLLSSRESKEHAVKARTGHGDSASATI
ncbi:MAG TPA: MFS transporter [Baekduia sp.]|nr:MFS transporter [Baekduia sp.]